jgi:hypothetical protein
MPSPITTQRFEQHSTQKACRDDSTVLILDAAANLAYLDVSSCIICSIITILWFTLALPWSAYLAMDIGNLGGGRGIFQSGLTLMTKMGHFPHPPVAIC